MKTNPITIVLAESDPTIQKSWHFIFGQDSRFQIVGIGDSGDKAVGLCEKLGPQIAIINVNLNGGFGLETIRFICRRMPDVKLIGLSVDARPQTAQKMLRHGVMGCLTTGSSPEEIFKTVLHVQEGRTYICEAFVDNLN